MAIDTERAAGRPLSALIMALVAADDRIRQQPRQIGPARQAMAQALEIAKELQNNPFTAD